MEYTINKLSQLAGVTSRTLRYYDSIDLLKPKRTNSAGYRIYGQEEVERLQQILFFREFELPLEEIKKVLDSPEYDDEGVLERHRQQLLAKRKQLDHLLLTIDKTLAHKRGDIKMTDKEKFAGFKKEQLADNEQKYGKEIREKYGAETAEESNKIFGKLTEKEYRDMENMAAQILEDLKMAMKTNNPESDEALALAELHKKWLGYTWPTYSKEAHRGLADMYIFDERFTNYYDKPVGKGAAKFLRDAIHAYIAK